MSSLNFIAYWVFRDPGRSSCCCWDLSSLSSVSEVWSSSIKSWAKLVLLAGGCWSNLYSRASVLSWEERPFSTYFFEGTFTGSGRVKTWLIVGEIDLGNLAALISLSNSVEWLFLIDLLKLVYYWCVVLIKFETLLCDPQINNALDGELILIFDSIYPITSDF